MSQIEMHQADVPRVPRNEGRRAVRDAVRRERRSPEFVRLLEQLADERRVANEGFYAGMAGAIRDGHGLVPGSLECRAWQEGFDQARAFWAGR